jgi:hypothetical protein
VPSRKFDDGFASRRKPEALTEFGGPARSQEELDVWRNAPYQSDFCAPAGPGALKEDACLFDTGVIEHQEIVGVKEAGEVLDRPICEGLGTRTCPGNEQEAGIFPLRGGNLGDRGILEGVRKEAWPEMGRDEGEGGHGCREGRT